jgi:hypothetical protein
MVLWRVNDSGNTATARSLCAVNSSLFATGFEILFGQMRCDFFCGTEDIVADQLRQRFSRNLVSEKSERQSREVLWKDVILLLARFGERALTPVE